MKQDAATWKKKASNFLSKHTRASTQAIEHFVALYWHNDLEDEDNLCAFEDYTAGLTDSYPS